MLSLAATLTLLTSSGGLLAEHLPTGVGLLDGADRVLLAARDEGPAPAVADYPGMSLSQLHLEWDRLEASKPGFGLGIGLTAAGAGALVLGLVLLVVQSPVVLVVGLVMLAAAVGLLIAGPIILSRILGERDRITREQGEVRRQMQLLQGGDAPLVPSGPRPPPPPPPRPLSDQGAEVPLVTLARF
jgi:hypothetical protein